MIVKKESSEYCEDWKEHWNNKHDLIQRVKFWKIEVYWF